MEQQVEVQFDYAESTDVGCVRELNEDSIFSKPGLWMVADGMGGHACGEVASAMAVAQVVDVYEKERSLRDAIQSAHQQITEAGRNDLAQSGMGTTIVSMACDTVASETVRYQLAWVGDSRAYLWDGRVAKLMQISEDHSLMVRLVKAGLISAEDAILHPQRHMITQCLGSTEIEHVRVDMVEREWGFNQQILLCSDGLTDEINDHQIAQVMASSQSLQEKALALVDRAKRAGGRDNISLILVDSPLIEAPSFMKRLQQKLVGWF